MTKTYMNVRNGSVNSHSWSWENFIPEELCCKGCKNQPCDEEYNLIISNSLLDKLQKLREYVGKPLIINSAYRCGKYNKQVGGGNKSQHLAGNAVDISLNGHNRYKLYKMAREVGFTGFGFYQSFLHCDIGNERHWFGYNGREAWVDILDEL